jgi:TonB family protein
MILALLAGAAIRALLLGVATWTTLRLLRQRNPHVEKLVWRVVVVAALALPVLLFWRLVPVLDVHLPASLLVAVSADPAAVVHARVSGSTRLPMAMVAIYLVVTMFLLARFLIGLARMARARRAARPMPDRGGVFVSAHVHGPATFGSSVLLPESALTWPATRLDVVLVHERAHVRFRDCQWSWLAQLHVVAFWFSPFSWWLRRRLAILAEATSDDAVLAAHHDHFVYAELLLEFARNPNPGRVAMSASGPNVSARIERILSHEPPSLPPRRMAGALAILAMIPAALFAAATAGGPANPGAYPELDDPHIISYGELVNLDQHYPPLAIQEQVEGMVMIGAVIDADGRVLTVTVLKELPADPRYGFGAAAAEVARTVLFDNPRKQPVFVKFQVKFALGDK